VEASLDGEREATWARRALGRTTDPRRAWRLLAARGFPEDVIADVVGDPD
jgi:SOS response regulatory protein OraA/RecX